ncbi:ABC transporter permease [Ruminiclostridium cellulolyticum]|uniref:ABC-type Na+ efflux pump permease component-like protein n=1 Tax=Ruminiclostridium cellulolyticum (strain ATCC 35319 / DSM 5812 / JCM 6584 / H10) TaxID=394503 RepID=B8I035_RUMCH|nr:ABC transporter permease [Ruminiclostridium cellulolyticum]ACL75535.1 ABC-type Na+ efflux pump permease component-like protein [Ruminiclostridium cellulolyticum H10]
MKEFLEVFKYTFKENVRKKSFIISTVLILVIVVAAMVIPAAISKSRTGGNLNPKEQTQTEASNIKTVYFIDKTGIFEQETNGLQHQMSGFKLEKVPADKEEGLKDQIKDKGESYMIVVSLKDNIPSVEYFTKQYGSGPNPEMISKAFKNVYVTTVLKGENVSEDVITKTLADLNINVNELGNSKVGGFVSSIFIVIILFFAIYFYGYGVSMSVASEKTSRVMELLITSVKPSRIIIGKTAGMGVLGLIQLALIIGVGAVTYKAVFPTDFTIDGMKLDLSGFTPFTFSMVIIYFILGYTLYALMYAVVGATVSKAEDVNSAMMPMSFIAIIAFYFSYGTFAVPDSTAAKIASIIPFTSPFSVPSRLVSTSIPLWEIGVSLGVLLIAITFVGMISVKLYSYAVLHYGDRLKIGKLLQVSKDNKTVVDK